MQRPAPGQYRTVPAAGEPVHVFVPAPLPPNPPRAWSPVLRRRFDDALVAWDRLDTVSALLPNAALVLHSFVRKESALTLQIEGTPRIPIKPAADSTLKPASQNALKPVSPGALESAIMGSRILPSGHTFGSVHLGVLVSEVDHRWRIMQEHIRRRAQVENARHLPTVATATDPLRQRNSPWPAARPPTVANEIPNSGIEPGHHRHWNG